MKTNPMGKGLNAILKAPERLKPVGRSEETAEEAAAPKRSSEGVATAEAPIEEVAAKEAIDAEATIEDAAATEMPGDEAAKATTAPKATTRGMIMSQEAISRAVSDAKRSPRISTWSPVAVSTLKFLRMTQPQFSMSDEIRTLIEDGLARKYPKLVEKIKKELEKSG
jgi:hypothetical protein